MIYKDGSRYYSFAQYCQDTFGHRLYKVALDAKMSCPNRDGTIDTRGCIFCSEGGSGDFAIIYDGQPITRKELLFKNYPQDIEGKCIAYFQAFTNTYAPIERLEHLYTSALEDPLFKGISIATRPDCVSEETIILLDKLNKKYPDKFIWVELGLQSIHEESAIWMRRGYKLEVFDECVRRLNEIDIPVIVHVILGLPNESVEDMVETVKYLNQFNIFGIKLQLLHFLEHTDLAGLYKQGKVKALSLDEYVEVVCKCIGYLSENTVIHRLTGDGPKDILLAPLWSTNKIGVINKINKYLKDNNISQSSLWQK